MKRLLIAAALTLAAATATAEDDRRRLYLSIGDPHSESETGFVVQTFAAGVEVTEKLRIGVVHYSEHGWGSWTYTTDGDPVDNPPQYVGLAANWETPIRLHDIGTFASVEARREIDLPDDAEAGNAIAAGAGLLAYLRDTVSVRFVVHYVRGEMNYIEPRFLFSVEF